MKKGVRNELTEGRVVQERGTTISQMFDVFVTEYIHISNVVVYPLSHIPSWVELAQIRIPNGLRGVKKIWDNPIARLGHADEMHKIFILQI